MQEARVALSPAPATSHRCPEDKAVPQGHPSAQPQAPKPERAACVGVSCDSFSISTQAAFSAFLTGRHTPP